MKYKIFEIDGVWKVYHCYMCLGELIKDNVVFWSYSIGDCYVWIKAKEEGLHNR
jgi:hypothetical protein